MPVRGEYINLKDFAEIAEQLTSKFPDKYGGLPIDKIRFYAMVNKERPNNKTKMFNWLFVPEALAQEISVDVICVIFLSSWANLGEKNKVLVVASALSCLQFDGDCIRSKGFDMQDHKDMVEMFGVDYENSPDVPDILGLEKL
jgi:hypothetical protein